MKRWLRRGAVAVSILLLAVLSWITVALRVETTASGVPVRWLLPIPPGNGGAIAIPIFPPNDRRVAIPGFMDGPIVTQDSGGWRARWWCEDRARQLQGNGPAVSLDCTGEKRSFDLAEATIPDPVQDMPARVFVLSDLEGDAQFLASSLRELGLMDAAGAWSGGAAHVVVLGDSVDRGRDVFGVLWTLRSLQRQAHAAGGAVHVVIGNHEQYLLRGIAKSAHPEHRQALERLGGHRAAFAQGTLIGNWLRALPVAVRLGDTAFVHGGLSAEAASALATPEAANATMQRYWRDLATLPQVTREPALDAVLGASGLTQFRGLLGDAPEGTAPMSESEVDRALSAWKSRRMVVAHTVVAEVHAVHGGRIWAVDLAEPELPQAVLAFIDGKPDVVRLRARRSANNAGHRVVPASEIDQAGLLGGTFREARRAAATPMPY